MMPRSFDSFFLGVYPTAVAGYFVSANYFMSFYWLVLFVIVGFGIVSSVNSRAWPEEVVE